MAGESNPRPPARPPAPPLLFQFPTLSPQPIWSIHAQGQQQQRQQMAAPPMMLPHPQSLEFQQMPQQRFIAIPPQQQQQQRYHLQQQQQQGGFRGNLNFQRPSPAPDLNSPASPAQLGFYARHHQKSQHMVFLERAGALVDQTTFLKETSPLAPVLPPPPPPPPRAQCQQLQQPLDLSKRHFSSKNEARQAKKSKRMEMPAVQTPPPPQRSSPFGREDLEQPESRVYPAPLADHREVVADEKLFLSTLSKFYEAMGGTPLRLPRFHGKDFEIHRLYCEVSEQGGMLKVIREKKWKDIATAFDLPRNVTNPVFFLRKNYETFLHHYEQVYFHRKTGAHIPPPGPLPMPAPVSENIKDHDSNNDSSKLNQTPANPASSLGHTVTGAIEGKFEHGYFVTVVVGSEKLRGVIYSVPQSLAEAQEQFADVESNTAENPQLLDPPDKKAGNIKARPPKKEKRKRRVEGIKSVRNGYNFFVGEQRQKLKGGGGRDEMSKIIGDLWSKLSEEEKEPYREMSKRDKERFSREVEEKKQRELRASEGHLDSGLEDDGGDDDDEDDDEKQARSENTVERYNVQLNTNEQQIENFAPNYLEHPIDFTQHQQADFTPNHLHYQQARVQET
ncbi:high mobility group B protein 15 [Selaginella moellendorffii]|uniref:high mobility group B protein 15 n=1 Tax=Selaginella moellendorffii TaxID=88036 RepID=UPI000D1CF1AD|nr:high mobility group B protein 15 [Selaginella moellendorffii]|eukprot:XP_024529863.1 high mobility group B protein 15 [Selaginella moellendorffii]